MFNWESISPFIIWGAFFALMYFLLIRPQQIQQRKRKEMLANLKVNDKVILYSGIIGVIKAIKEGVLVIEVAPKVELNVIKEGVAQVQVEK